MPNNQKAIILDLDGVLFELVDHCGEYGVSARTENEIKIIDGLQVLFHKLSKEFVIIGATNQPDIGRKKITSEFLNKKHKALLAIYPEIQKIYVCPHTETDLCFCRKPKPGLLIKASKDFNIDFSQSWMIGDSRSDVEAGILVYAKTVFIQTKYNCGNPAITVATAVAKSVRGALGLILALKKRKPNLADF